MGRSDQFYGLPSHSRRSALRIGVLDKLRGLGIFGGCPPKVRRSNPCVFQGCGKDGRAKSSWLILPLINSQRLGQIPREIGVEAAHHAHVIREHLQRQNSQQRTDIDV